MNKYFKVLIVVVSLHVGVGLAQTTVTNGNDGTTNTIPKYNGTAGLTNSIITESGGGIGIGTTTPLATLNVNGSFAISSPSIDNFIYGFTYDASNFAFEAHDAANTTKKNILFAPWGGNIGFGVTSPQTTLQVGDYGSGTSEASSHGLIMIQGSNDLNSGPNGLEFKSAAWGSGSGWKIFSADRGSGNTALSFAYRSSSATWGELFTMRPDTGNIGIAQPNPSERFEVNGNIKVSGGIKMLSGGGGAITFPDTTVQNTAYNPASLGTLTSGTWNGSPISSAYLPSNVVYTYSIPDAGGSAQWVKIGTFTADQYGASIDIKASIHSGFNASNGQDGMYHIQFKTSNGSSVDPNGFAGNGSWYNEGANAAVSSGNIKWVANASGVSATAFDLYIYLPTYTHGSHYSVTRDQNTTWTNIGAVGVSDPGGASSAVMVPPVVYNLPQGNIGIGTTSPGERLEVSGNIKLTSGSGASMTYADGTVQSTAWTGTLTGGDYAESMDVTGTRDQYEPGDVLVLDPEHPGKVLKSSERYSLAVSGVYSTKPGLVGRRQKIAKDLAITEVPMAMVGVVPTKVSTENGAIKPGDVLVTSSKAGYAMKGTDRSLFAGAVIGKAMSSLDSGTGVIEALISLQ